jgi:hypothetical protein
VPVVRVAVRPEPVERRAGAVGRLGPGTPGRLGHVGAARRGRGVHDDGEVDRDPEVPAQRTADRLAEHALDRGLGELARRGEQRGAVDEAERPGQPQERALLRGEGRGVTRGRAGAGEIGDDLAPDLGGDDAGLVGHTDPSPSWIVASRDRAGRPQTCPQL